MIRIAKGDAPDILRVQGVRRHQAHCTSYTRAAADYDSGAATFPFDPAIYGHVSVRIALRDAQHRKCAFCESRIGDDGDVEHFRPKAAVRQDAGTALVRSGYYWLAYDWDNLLLSCGPCNQRHKGNLFPLADPAARCRTHRGDVAAEAPLFLNPAQENPQEYLGFRDEIVFAIDGNARGEVTIHALGLNRLSLAERRREWLELLRGLQNVVLASAEEPGNAGLQREAVNALGLLEKSCRDDAEFAAMTRAAFPSLHIT